MPADRLETAFPGDGSGKIYEWDPAKRKAARRKHGVDFASMLYFDWGTAADDDSEVVDGEQRDSVLGLINGALHRATYTECDGKMRMIALRKAGKTRPIPLERLRRMGMTLAVARREAREAAAGSDADQTA